MRTTPLNTTTRSNRIAVSAEFLRLCRLNTSLAWKTLHGSYSPAVSVYSVDELRSGLPSHTDKRAVRFSKRGVTKTEKGAEGYALRWMLRFNRMLENGMFGT